MQQAERLGKDHTFCEKHGSSPATGLTSIIRKHGATIQGHGLGLGASGSHQIQESLLRVTQIQRRELNNQIHVH